MLISHEGMMVRCAVKDVRSTGRAAQGVRLINIKGKDRVASIARVAPQDEAEQAGAAKSAESEAAPAAGSDEQAIAPKKPKAAAPKKAKKS